MVLQKVEIEKAFITKLDDYIIELKFKDKVDFELDDAIETDRIYFELSKGKPFLALIDARDILGTISSEAREFFATDELVADIRIAEALVVNSLPIKLLASFYVKFHQTKNPKKVFTEYDKAVEWLKQQFKIWQKKQ